MRRPENYIIGSVSNMLQEAKETFTGQADNLKDHIYNIQDFINKKVSTKNYQKAVKKRWNSPAIDKTNSSEIKQWDPEPLEYDVSNLDLSYLKPDDFDKNRRLLIEFDLPSNIFKHGLDPALTLGTATFELQEDNKTVKLMDIFNYDQKKIQDKHDNSVGLWFRNRATEIGKNITDRGRKEDEPRAIFKVVGETTIGE